jgi:hypothetical protein
MPAEAATYISIQLTPDEVCLAANHAIMRRRAKLVGERRDREQGERSTWENEVEGACAELAFCKHHGIYWSGVSALRARDGGVEDVRWTRHSNGGLIVYPKDPDSLRLVLLDGHAPIFRIVGWLYSREGKRKEDYLDKAGYFLVPRQMLRLYAES